MNNFTEAVYYSVLGELIEEYQVEGVENVFAAGKPCDQLYLEVMHAYDRLRERLGIESEDPDIESIINAFFGITREVAYQMYKCGAKFGNRQ